MTLTSDQLWACRDLAVKVATPIVGEPQDAEDVGQLVLVSMWQRYHAFSGTDSDLMALCKRVATNKSLDLLRQRSRTPETTPVEVDEISESVLGDKAVDFDDPESLFAAEQLDELISLAVNKLTRPCWQAWTMWVSGCTIDVIASTLGVTESNARKIVWRAREEVQRAVIGL